jgi:glycine cleavage system T protein
LKQSKLSDKFVFEAPPAEPVGSVLYQEHLKLIDKSRIAAFAGYLMPLWYSSITAEHNAVRQAAGLFDCTHMGVLEVAGPDAAEFLNFVTTNEVNNLTVGKTQYSYILDAVGNVLDDIITYRRGEDKFMVVVNAANENKIKAYLRGLENDELLVDADEPTRKLEYKPAVRDMKDTNTGSDCRVDIALQGPMAANILLSLLKNTEDRQHIENLKPFSFIETPVDGIDCIVSRTGYTGAKIGFELFVHPEKAPQLWDRLLQNGKSSGLLPCGLGARDSLRIEAGLPLYGHELAGPFNISPFEAGYGWAVKLEKDFFIGKSAMERTAGKYDMKVVRIELPGAKGIRPVRQNDGVLNSDGECIGWVLSGAKAGEKQVALVYVVSKSLQENNAVGIYYLARSQSQIQQGRYKTVEKGQTLEADITGKVVSRFAKF